MGAKAFRALAGGICALWLSALSAGFAETDPNPAQNSATLTEIRNRGYLVCGVGIDDIGFAMQQVDGSWAGFDIDLCRAVATAVLGDASAVEFVQLDSLNRLDVLGAGGVDVLFRTTTFTFKRDVAQGFEFPAITFYDTQKVLAYADTGARRLGDLAGKKICANSGTTSIANIRHAIAQSGAAVDILEIGSQAGRWRAFFGRECDAVTADGSDLAAMMASRPGYRADFVMLEDEIANEPLGVVVREGDQLWEHIIRWVVNLTLHAEAVGMTQAGATEPPAALDLPDGQALGLIGNWGPEVVRQVGNYGEIYHRNLGAGSALNLPRGLNRLWKDGGVMYPLPMAR